MYLRVWNLYCSRQCVLTGSALQDSVCGATYARCVQNQGRIQRSCRTQASAAGNASDSLHFSLGSFDHRAFKSILLLPNALVCPTLS